MTRHFSPENIMRIGRFAPSLFALTTVFALAAGGGDDTGDAAEGGANPEQAAPAVDPAQAATITGMVHLNGTPAANESIDMSSELACAAKHSGSPAKHTVVAKNGILKNVFVYVKEGLPAGNYPASGAAPVLDQDGCQYEPHVMGVQVGQELVIRNSDDVSHNVKATPQANRTFNISQPTSGMESRRSFSAREVMIPVECSVHGWMEAYIGVLDHPYFAVTGDDGSFRIQGLPPGTYTIEAWHEKYGTQTQTVTVAAQQMGEAMFTYDAAATAAVVPLGKPLVISHAHAHPAPAATPAPASSR
jgi:plastocyanin